MHSQQPKLHRIDSFYAYATEKLKMIGMLRIQKYILIALYVDKMQ